MTLAVEVAGKTDIGCVRVNNEDNFGYDSRYGIFVVCDGMGGHAAGEVSSKIGVCTVLNYVRHTGAPRDFQHQEHPPELLSPPAAPLTAPLRTPYHPVFLTLHDL